MADADPYIYPSPQNGRPSDFRTRQPCDDPQILVDDESRRAHSSSGTREILRRELDALYNRIITCAMRYGPKGLSYKSVVTSVLVLSPSPANIISVDCALCRSINGRQLFQTREKYAMNRDEKIRFKRDSFSTYLYVYDASV